MASVLSVDIQDSKIHTPKIIHVVISMVVGGAERLVYDMVRYPVFAANPPVVCCMDSLGELGEKLIREGYRVYCKGRRPGLDLEMVTWLRDIIRREKADVVHAHQYSPLFYAVPAALLAGRVKLVYTEHGRFYPERKSWKRTLFNPLLALGVDHLVSISRATAQAMASYDNFPLRRIRVIHNGIDTTRLNPPVDKAAKRRELGLCPTCRIIGTAARLNSIKNIDMMLRVLKLVVEKVPDTCLVIAGQGEEEQRLKALAVELGIADSVKFIGLRFDLPEVYQLYDVFLLTSFSEGISVTLLEAMASGVPAVVTDVGGNREVVVEGETGFMVAVDDDGAMGARVVRMLADTSSSPAVGDRARERVAAAFSVAGMMNNYTELYGCSNFR
ncbi:glycosyltransferase [Pelobacter propionicus]|uniref:Glycosyl transferase, group 1 n=1 Tax=Pelobacter propionicus (strain DSM 2379 / NBRC 103807 / OttBd1) TaxID=338966 RepID=A1ARU8_PELPD|nr:glycosyltransferase [Pelobacter propionicus]ABL00069.1 glycosyl transferase, group 1 [Pelobacter propionicus DSM 2379]